MTSSPARSGALWAPTYISALGAWSQDKPTCLLWPKVWWEVARKYGTGCVEMAVAKENTDGWVWLTLTFEFRLADLRFLERTVTAWVVRVCLTVWK